MKNIVKKIKRKSSRFLKKRKGSLFASMLTIVIVISLLFIFKNFEIPKETNLSDKYEITEIDIFSLESINANDVSVMGLSVGDRTKDVLETLGTPDMKADYSGGVSNWEYSKSLDLEEAGVIINLESGIVESITIRNAFNSKLVGETSKVYTKAEIYQKFGIPDRTLFMPVKKDSILIIRLLRYEDIGIDFIVRKKQAIGFTLKLNDN